MSRFLSRTILLAIAFLISLTAASAKDPPQRSKPFDPQIDLLALHYDHAPDKDDGQSAAADRTILQAKFDAAWIKKHVVPVSGAYGINKKEFNSDSDAVMNAAWNDSCGWLAAHDDRTAVVEQLVKRWAKTLQAGGDIWIKEGGQSDITADLVRRLKKQLPEINTVARIHLVQHGRWNENHTTSSELAYVKRHTEYLKIPGANRYLRRDKNNTAFVRAAKSHPTYGPAWKAAFAYCNPKRKLDFSDTGELMYILGLGEMSIDQFQGEFLQLGKGKR